MAGSNASTRVTREWAVLIEVPNPSRADIHHENGVRYGM